MGYQQTLLDWNSITSIQSTQVSVLAGIRKTLVLANPMRLALKINLNYNPTFPATIQYFPIDELSQQAMIIDNTTLFLDFEIWKHFSLAQCQWDVLVPAVNETYTIIEVIYRGP